MFKSISQEEKERFMQKAVEISKEGASSGLGTPFGAVIVKDGKVIAESANRSFIDYDPTAHAEVSAIRKACKELKTIDLTGCHIYTSCYPCKLCMSAIYWARLEAFFYAVTMEDYPSADYVSVWNEEMKEDEVKPNEERTIFREWVSSSSEAAKKVGEEWQLKSGKVVKD